MGIGDKNLIKQFTLIVAVIASGQVFAQRYAPNHIDLRASYCVAFHKHIVSENFPILADEMKFAGLYGADFVEQIRASTASSENDLSRLQSYMLPRIKFLDVEGLLLAANQFTKDSNFLKLCQSKCSSIDCMNICPISTGYKERATLCIDLNWIPF